MLGKKLPGALAAALVALGVGASAAHAQATITVTKPGNAGPGTLRNAINQANAQATLSTITFNLPPAAAVITPQNDLPAFTAPVIVDGYTPAGTRGVVIDAINTVRALELATDDSLIQGVVIHDSTGNSASDGIWVGGNDNKLKGNYVGTDTAGGVLNNMWNLTTGVVITGDGNLVGGMLPEEANVISEANAEGVVVTGDENAVQGNRIGLPIGGGGLGNGTVGLAITGDHNAVGGTAPEARNVVTGNGGDGVAITGNENRVDGNYVGVDETGAAGQGNNGDGIAILGNDNLVEANVSANNNFAGVALDGTSNTVLANALGTDAGMTVGLGNGVGVLINGNSNRVGGQEGEERNVISGNSFEGVKIETGANNRVEGNRIGTDGDGTAAIPNDEGVFVTSSFNLITGNLLSGNNIAGVQIDDGPNGPAVNNGVDDNIIGLDASGTVALPNDDGVVIEDAHNNWLQDNVISDNVFNGVLIERVDLAGADGNWLTGNTIERNGSSGVWIDGGDDNSVGQPIGPQNTISDNGDDGVTVATGQRNSVVNNSIVDNVDEAIDLAADGPTANDGLGDLDAGPNGLQNHPNITGRTLIQEWSDDPFPILELKTAVSWNLRSAGATDYLIELYAGEGCGRGDAGRLLATRNVTTDAQGLAEGSIVLDPALFIDKLSMTATVTDPNGVVLGASSELSPCA